MSPRCWRAARTQRALAWPRRAGLPPGSFRHRDGRGALRAARAFLAVLAAAPGIRIGPAPAPGLPPVRNAATLGGPLGHAKPTTTLGAYVPLLDSKVHAPADAVEAVPPWTAIRSLRPAGQEKLCRPPGEAVSLLAAPVADCLDLGQSVFWAPGWSLLRRWGSARPALVQLGSGAEPRNLHVRANFREGDFQCSTLATRRGCSRLRHWSCS